MKHLVHVVKDKDAFLYYKFRPEDDSELWVPWDHGCGSGTPAEQGDILWFVRSTPARGVIEVLGAVPILRAQEDHINGRWELWYVGTSIVQAPEGCSVSLYGHLNEELWEELCRRDTLPSVEQPA